MEALKEHLSELYEELKGTREKNGSLIIEGYGQEEYEILYEFLVKELAPVMSGDFWSWYKKTVKSYIRFRKANSRRIDYDCPLDKPIDTHSLQEQLAVFKYYLYRRKNSNF